MVVDEVTFLDQVVGDAKISQDLRNVAKAALEKDIRVYSLSFAKVGRGDRVFSRDISSLDPGAEDDEVSGWGGLTGFSSRFGRAVRKAANEQRDA